MNECTVSPLHTVVFSKEVELFVRSQSTVRSKLNSQVKQTAMSSGETLHSLLLNSECFIGTAAGKSAILPFIVNYFTETHRQNISIQREERIFTIVHLL